MARVERVDQHNPNEYPVRHLNADEEAMDMDNTWGRILLGIGAAAVTWRAMGPQKQQGLMNFLETLALELQQQKLQKEYQERLALEPPRPVESVLKLEETVSEPLQLNLPPIDFTLKEFLPKAQLEPDARWLKVIVAPAVILILGRRGSGKSATAYRLLELFRHRLTPYVVGAPGQAKKLLPEWMGIVSTLEELPQHSIALIDEAYLAYHARESLGKGSTSMSQMLNLSRQRDQTLIIVSQESRQIDKNISSSASVLIFKELGMLQPEFERPELRRLVGEARDALAKQPGDKRKWSYVYAPDSDFVGPMESSLPTFWKPSLSKLFATESKPSTPRAAKKESPQEKAQRAKELRARGYTYSQIMNELGVSKATVVNYLKGYPYRR